MCSRLVGAAIPEAMGSRTLLFDIVACHGLARATPKNTPCQNRFVLQMFALFQP